MIIIKQTPLEGSNYHPIQSQGHRTSCWLPGYLELPKAFHATAWDCMGYCQLVIEDGVIRDLIPLPLPELDTQEV